MSPAVVPFIRLRGLLHQGTGVFILLIKEVNKMHPYPESYLDEVVENQGRLFDLVANSYPDKDTRDFIIAFMSGKTRKYMDQGQTYVNTIG